MQVSIEQTGALERRMEVSVPKERVEKAVDERLQKVSRTARLKGFRPGKAPVSMVRTRYGGEVRDRVMRMLLPEAIYSAIEESKLKVIGENMRMPAHELRVDATGNRSEVTGTGGAQRFAPLVSSP